MKFAIIITAFLISGCVFYRQTHIYATGDKFLSPYGTLNNAEVNYDANTEFNIGCVRSKTNTAN